MLLTLVSSLDDNPNTLLFVGGAAVVGERGLLRVVGGRRHEAHIRRRPDWLRVRRSVDRGLLLQTRGKPIGADRVFGGFSVVRQTFAIDISSASVIMNHVMPSWQEISAGYALCESLSSGELIFQDFCDRFICK